MKIIRSVRKSISLRVKDGELIVRAPVFMLKGQIEDFVEKHREWIDKQLLEHSFKPQVSEQEIKDLKKQAKNYIINRVEEIAEENWFKYNNIRITSAKTRWWSCTSKKNLNFSYYLIWASREVIDYVIIHELAHLREMNHSRAFRNIVESIMPDYKIYRKWLKDHGNTLIF